MHSTQPETEHYLVDHVTLKASRRNNIKGTTKAKTKDNWRSRQGRRIWLGFLVFWVIHRKETKQCASAEVSMT